MTKHEEKVFDNRYRLDRMTDEELEEFIDVAQGRIDRHNQLWLLAIVVLFFHSVPAGLIGIGVYGIARWIKSRKIDWAGRAFRIKMDREDERDEKVGGDQDSAI